MLLERNQIGKREYLADLISRVDAKSTPITAMMPKGDDVTNMLMEWQMDDFEDPSDSAVEDGADAESFDNASPNRALAQMYAMKVRTTAMVSDLAENVSNVAGISGGESAESIMKKIEKLGRDIEAFVGGDQETQAGAAGVAYKGRGLGKWIQATAQATLPVDANYLTPAASIDTTAVGSLTTTIVDDVLQSSYQVTGKRTEFDLIAGPTLKRQFSTFNRVTAAANTYSVLRSYDTKFDGKIDNVVDIYNGDFGMIALHTTLFNAHASFGGSDAANLRRGYLLPMNLVSLHYKRKPRVKQLEDQGGGPRFLVDAIVGWKVKNPKALCKFAATT